MNKRDLFWHRYFSNLHGRHDIEPAKRVGMSNDRVTAQEYALVIEAAGVLLGKRALDVGCGLGPLARGLNAFGATAHGIDYVQPTIEALKESDPGIDWSYEDISNPSPTLLARRYDVICACEVLQHVDPVKVLPMLWGLLAPGGRLVGFVPNAECPIVQRVQKAYPDSYRGLTSDKLITLARGLPDLGGAFHRGATFQVDHTVAPYAVSAWTSVVSPAPATPPNRLQFVWLRRPGVEAPPAP